MKKRKIICLVKIVPDVEQMSYDYEKNILVREQVKSIINPDDSCAVAAALRLKEKCDAHVTVISMGPPAIRKYLEDLVRRGIDRAVLITDSLYAGSDTYVTSRILGRCVKQYDYDMILAGTHSLDGDTAHIPCQLAELLDINVMSSVVKIQEDNRSDGNIQFEVKNNEQCMEFLMELPAVLAVSDESKYKLPYVRYEDLKKNVSGCISVITNEELGFAEDEVGLKGSMTKVVKTYIKPCSGEEGTIVQIDEAGIEYVYQFLKQKGFV